MRNLEDCGFGFVHLYSSTVGAVMGSIPKWATCQVEEFDDWADDLPLYAQVVYVGFFLLGALVSLPIKLLASAGCGMMSGIIAGCTWAKGDE